jgi:hypothetical protein
VSFPALTHFGCPGDHHASLLLAKYRKHAIALPVRYLCLPAALMCGHSASAVRSEAHKVLHHAVEQKRLWLSNWLGEDYPILIFPFTDRLCLQCDMQRPWSRMKLACGMRARYCQKPHLLTSL